MTDENFFRVSIKGIVIENGKYLLARESNDMWEMLGGGLDHEEAPLDCLRREVREETGLRVTWISDSPIYFVTGQRHERNGYAANVVYEIKLENLNFTPSDECQELKFFSPDEMADLNMFLPLKQLAKILQDEQTGQ